MRVLLNLHLRERSFARRAFIALVHLYLMELHTKDIVHHKYLIGGSYRACKCHRNRTAIIVYVQEWTWFLAPTKMGTK
jgi:hypothetical protein